MARMVSEDQCRKTNNNHCLWECCPKSSDPFDTVEDLLEHVLEAHIPKVVKNEDGEEEVVCEWDQCEMSTIRGDITKKTEWMTTHFKTRHITNARPFKCLIEGCSVSKATKVSPVAAEPPKVRNTIWKIVNGRCVWDKPVMVTKKTIVYYDDGPRYVFPKGYSSDQDELESDEYWSEVEYSDDECQKCAPSYSQANIPRPGVKCASLHRYRKRIKKKRAPKIQKRKEEEDEKKADINNNVPEKSEDIRSEKPELVPTLSETTEGFDEYDGMPVLTAYFENSEEEDAPILEMEIPMVEVFVKEEKVEGKKKPEEWIKIIDIVDELPFKKEILPIIKIDDKQETVVQRRGRPRLLPTVEKTQKKPEPKLETVRIPSPTKPQKSDPPAPQSLKISRPTKNRKVMKPRKRPSRACRVLGSMEEVPFELEIEVEFEKPRKMLKAF
ncbi:Protein CBG07041 [Caenorhabditis briggsae]|uniref:Protein CBG07041 n=1 Tax=Caenorhabditis briggsae TaxID=6238 RepID=A8X3U7_CAEBR|nr:Protein CBG07041 [Caenorhabditis briggsae]CAP27307.2 Protein CBG07041 [Caenorhabditis briggsae]